MWAYAILGLLLHSVTAWDPDAGLVLSYTKYPTASVTATSNADTADLTVDGDPQTHWTSHGCLPNFYFANPETNVLLTTCASSGGCTTANVDELSPLDGATDGDTYTNTNLRKTAGASGAAILDVNVPNPQPLQYVSIRAKYDAGATTTLNLYNQNTLLQTFSLTDADNYDAKLFQVTATQTVTHISIEFPSTLMIWEIDAIGQDGCVESVTYDIGEVKEVGVVKSRHWAGGQGLTTRLLVSTDNVNWVTMNDLDPDALGTVTTIFPSPVQARYIKITQQHSFNDYAKVYMWEVDAYDANGEFGPRPTPQPNPVSLRKMLGVNGIWGWGHNQMSDTLAAGEGPYLYAPVATHGRNYHNMEWDVTDPDISADYDKMAAGGGTQSKSWVNWDREYSTWRKANLSVHVSVQFTSSMFPPNVWDTPAASAHRYGEEFARHFGPTQGTGDATAVEVGNEPWDYDATFYNTILRNMAQGFKAGDSQLLVMPGAFQADNKDDDGNYIGTRVTEDIAPFLDVVNFHHYSFLTRTNGVRITTYPEHPGSVFNTLRNILRWRDVNMPSTPVWVTEWGWDSAGAGQDCQFSECVSEKAASVYATRGLMVHARSGFERSTWFFYSNTDCNSHVFCRCGLTGNGDVSFAKKNPYLAFQNFLNIMGQAIFLSVIKEDTEAYVYAFGYQNGGNAIVTHVAAWRPVDADADTSSANVSFDLNATPIDAFCQNEGTFPACQSLPSVANNVWSIDITFSPTIVRVQESPIDSVIVG